MKFRVIVSGKALGFLPVRVTPVDVPVPIAIERGVALWVAGIPAKDLRFTGFSGQLTVTTKA